MKIIIFLIGLMGVVVAGFFPGTKNWVRGVIRKPWISCVIFSLYICLFLGGPRSLSELISNPFDSYRYTRVGLLGVLFLWSMFIIIFNSKLVTTGAGIMWTTAYAVTAMISSVYSPFKLLTLFKSFEVITSITVMLALSIYLRSKENLEDFIGINIVPLILLSFSSLAGAILMPSIAIKYDNSGDVFSFLLEGVAPLLSANALTQISGILFVLLFNEYLQKRKQNNRFGIFILMGIFLLTVVLSHSRTSLIAILIAVSFVLVRNGAVGLAAFISWVAVLFAVIGPVRQLIIDYIYRGQNTSGFSSLTGRTEFWPIVWSKAMQSPIFGHGFYAAHRVNWGASTTDNAYLEVFLGVGVVGFVFFIMGILLLIKGILKIIKYKILSAEEKNWENMGTQLCVIFIFLIIRSLTGPSFQVFHINLILFLMLQVTVTSIYRIKRYPATQNYTEE